MSNRLGVKFEDVEAACERLISNNITPTASTVRKELGWGSYTTILNFINQFEDKKALANQVQIEEPPNTLNQIALEMLQKVWTASSVEHQKKLEDIRDNLSKELQEAVEKNHKLGAELQDANQEIESLERQLEDLKTDNLELKNANLIAKEQLTSLNNKNQQLETELRDLIEKNGILKGRIESNSKKN